MLAQTAQIAAAASGASAGIGQLGNPGDSLQVNAARTGLVFGPSDGKVGDVLISARNPGPLFVPANGGIRAQSALPSLLGMLGYPRRSSWPAIRHSVSGCDNDRG